MPFAKYSVLDKNCLGAMLETFVSDTACLMPSPVLCHFKALDAILLYICPICAIKWYWFCCLFKHFLHLVGGPHLATYLCASLLCMKL